MNTDNKNDELVEYSESLMEVLKAKLWHARVLKAVRAGSELAMKQPYISVKGAVGYPSSPVGFDNALRKYLLNNWEEISHDVISDMEFNAEAVRKQI